MFSRRHKQRELEQGLPREWRPWVAACISQWPLLDEDERVQLEDDANELIVMKRWEPAYGFVITDEVRVSIAAQAAMLVLGLDFEEPYAKVESIVVHATTVTLAGENPGPAVGTVRYGQYPLYGLAASNRGPVVIAWDEAQLNARHPERGHNVVFHEFAHKLDMINGAADGMPPLATQEARDRWNDVCKRAFLGLQQGEIDDVLDPYAGVSQSEFFAVVTEVFFDRPVELEDAKPELYDVLRGFYRQDPAARVRSAR